MAYIITKQWNNGEAWEDYHETEEPIAIYDNLKDLVADLEAIGLELTKGKYDESYYFELPEEEIERFKCPFGKAYNICSQECWGGYEAYEEAMEREEEGLEIDYPLDHILCEDQYYKDTNTSSTRYLIYKIKNKNSLPNLKR